MESTAVCEKSDDEASDGGLTIVTDSPKKPKNKWQAELKPEEKEVVESFEKECEEVIEEKAVKSNLSIRGVKHLLRQVVTNEHVIALVRQAENPDMQSEVLFEPKLTRAKAKELHSSTSLPWLTPNRSPSEVQKLITEELDEDSSGDEYVPAEEESEDDRDSSVLSETDLRSISPPTPLQIPESPKEVSYSEDGVFKIPPVKTQETLEAEEANIALRTRSKLSLSATPLEVIEEAFIPPDITTDMYDMDCDDDDWREFLKKFTRPLDEVVKPTEDEDYDPEYNILADEDCDAEVDIEELRADKAVKITKKELNALFAELFDGTDFGDDQDEVETHDDSMRTPETTVIDTVVNINEPTNDTVNLNLKNPQSFDTSSSNSFPTIQPSCPTVYNFMMQVDQKLLLEQQMRQHVQMLTQDFLLTYQHPEFHGIAMKVREFLVNLILLAGSKPDSVFKPCNLEEALKLVEHWENQFALDTDEVKSMKEYVCRVQQEAKQCWAAGTEYILTFPPLILETISKSNVFIYPNLLPRIPFKSTYTQDRCSSFSEYEDQLLAIGLEQFIPHLAEEQKNLTSKGEVKLKVAANMIVNYMMPPITTIKVYTRILNLKNSSSGMNPVKYYFQHKKAPVTMHYVPNLSEFGIVPPCKRAKEVLPIQWRKYIYPETLKEPEVQTRIVGTFTKVTKPPPFNKSAKKRGNEKSFKSTLSPVGAKFKNNVKKTPSIYCSTPKANLPFKTKKLEHYFKTPKLLGAEKFKDSCIRCFKFNSSLFRKLRNKRNLDIRMLPSMPALALSTNSSSTDAINLTSTVNNNNCTNSSATVNCNETVEADSTITINADEEEVVEKDNEDDINALMVASSTIKNIGRKSLTGAEKKKAKLCREYNATLTMLTPEDPSVVQERAQNYAQAYFDKARERLDPQEYEQFMEILNNFNEGTGRAVDLYKKMEALLGTKHQDLLDEFLTFLTSAQARDVGKLILYYKLGNMSLFLHKLEIYFKDQPAHLRKIYRSLTELATCVDVTMDRVKNTILPLLKGNSLLVDWFLQIFPSEPPPKSLLSGPWEQIDVRGEFTPSKDLFETVTVPDDEDLYGGPNCICSCHQGENTVFKSRLQHCTPCGLKFVQGRVYVQTEKGLRLANVSFPENSDIDHNIRLNCAIAKKRKHRSETSPSKQLTSPTKETPDEVRTACDSEDEVDCSRKRIKASKSPRKKRVKINDKPDKMKKTQPELEEVPINSISDEQNNITNSETVNKVTFKDDDFEATKPGIDEIPEWDCNTSIESVELKHSPEHSADSESEFCEESSQDNINTETDDTAEELESCCNSPVHSENSNSNTFAETMWTREEDKIILETFQKKGDKEEALVIIANELPYRTIADIKDRFNVLMAILQKLISSGNSAL